MELRILIEEMIENMGFRTYPGYPEDYIWIDHGDSTGEVIFLVESDDMEKVREFHSSTSSFPGERFAFILYDGPYNEIYSYCKSHNITVVSREECSRLFGKALIDMHLNSLGKKEVKKLKEKDDREFILVYLEEGKNPKFIKPAVSGEMVSKSVGMRNDLIFIPYYFFSYRLKVMEGGSLEEREGSAMVNSLNGKVFSSITGYEVLENWPMTHRELEPKWEPLASLERVKVWIQESLEMEVMEKSESEFFLLYARNKVKPLKETIKVTYLNTYFYPIYSSSSLAMDGFTGEVKSTADYIT
jgi:hypothetical protein